MCECEETARLEQGWISTNVQVKKPDKKDKKSKKKGKKKEPYGFYRRDKQ